MGKKEGIIYLGYRIGECGVGRHWRLSVTITPLIRCMCGSGITLTLKMWGYLAWAVDLGFSWAWSTLVRCLVRTHWYRCLSVAVGGDGSSVWRVPAVIRAYWGCMGVRWLLAPTWCC